MSWIRRETEKGTVQYICPNCRDYHEFQEDFGEHTFSENFIFCRRCGAKNGTGTPPTLTPPNEWISVEERLPEKSGEYLILTDEKEIYTLEFEEDFGDKGEFGWWTQKYFKEGWAGSDWAPADDITHWMLLPKPPKEED